MSKVIDIVLIGGLLYAGYLYIQQDQDQSVYPRVPLEPIVTEPVAPAPVDPKVQEDKDKLLDEVTKSIPKLQEIIKSMEADPASNKSKLDGYKMALEQKKVTYERITGHPYIDTTPKFDILPVKPKPMPVFKTPVYSLY